MAVRLYAVLRLRPRPRPGLPRGMHGEPLKILKYAGCAVAVAEMHAPLDPEVENLLEFDRVIRGLAEVSEAILPARFGAVAPSEAALKSDIGGRAGVLAAALDNVTGCVQMTVRLPAESPEFREEGSVTGAAYLRTRAAMSRPAALTKLRKGIAGLLRDERIAPGPGGLTVYHLIDRRHVAAYLARLKKLRASGPFPPYAFAPGIDHAIWPGYEDEKSQSAGARSTRPRTHRRSPRNASR
jgi:gas vesicle protein GvpL/GvpF